MPITPFHFGPGAALHVLAPRHVSFIAFCAANVLMDVEPLYFMLTQQVPLHRFFHTFIGAALIVPATVGLFAGLRVVAARLWLPNLFGWRGLGVRQVALGAAAGSFSHVILDSLMHADMLPLAPFSAANPLLQAVSLGTLHLACLAAGVLALGVQAVRWWMVGDTRP